MTDKLYAIYKDSEHWHLELEDAVEEALSEALDRIYESDAEYVPPSKFLMLLAVETLIDSVAEVCYDRTDQSDYLSSSTIEQTKDLWERIKVTIDQWAKDSNIEQGLTVCGETVEIPLSQIDMWKP